MWHVAETSSIARSISLYTISSTVATYAPQLRTQIVDALLQNESRAAVLLDAVDDGQISPLEIDAARRQRLTLFRAPPLLHVYQKNLYQE